MGLPVEVRLKIYRYLVVGLQVPHFTDEDEDITVTVTWKELFGVLQKVQAAWIISDESNASEEDDDDDTDSDPGRNQSHSRMSTDSWITDPFAERDEPRDFAKACGLSAFEALIFNSQLSQELEINKILDSFTLAWATFSESNRKLTVICHIMTPFVKDTQKEIVHDYVNFMTDWLNTQVNHCLKAYKEGIRNQGRINSRYLGRTWSICWTGACQTYP